jgi:hypothetical protein
MANRDANPRHIEAPRLRRSWTSAHLAEASIVGFGSWAIVSDLPHGAELVGVNNVESVSSVLRRTE